MDRASEGRNGTGHSSQQSQSRSASLSRASGPIIQDVTHSSADMQVQSYQQQQPTIQYPHTPQFSSSQSLAQYQPPQFPQFQPQPMFQYQTPPPNPFYPQQSTPFYGGQLACTQPASFAPTFGAQASPFANTFGGFSGFGGASFPAMSPPQQGQASTTKMISDRLVPTQYGNAMERVTVEQMNPGYQSPPSLQSASASSLPPYGYVSVNGVHITAEEYLQRTQQLDAHSSLAQHQGTSQGSTLLTRPPNRAAIGLAAAHSSASDDISVVFDKAAGIGRSDNIQKPKAPSVKVDKQAQVVVAKPAESGSKVKKPGPTPNRSFDELQQAYKESEPTKASTSKRPHQNDDDDLADYSDSEANLKDSAKSDTLPDGFIPIPRYDHQLPGNVSASLICEHVVSVTPAELHDYEELVRESIILQIEVMARTDLPTVDAPKLTEAEKATNKFRDLLAAPYTYKLGDDLPSAVVVPPLMRKLPQLQAMCSERKSRITNQAREAGAFIHACQGRADCCDVKSYKKAQDLSMSEYVPKKLGGNGLRGMPSFFHLSPAHSGAKETFIKKDCTAMMQKLITDEPKKLRDLSLAFVDLPKSRADFGYLFGNKKLRPKKVYITAKMAAEIMKKHPNLGEFLDEYWAWIDKEHKDIIFVTYRNIPHSFIHPDTQVCYMDTSNRHSLLGLAYGTEAGVCFAKSTVRTFGVPEPMMQEPGLFVHHNQQLSGRTLNIVLPYESTSEAIQVEREFLFKHEYEICPRLDMHPVKIYNPKRLTEQGIKVAMGLLRQGDRLTCLEGALFSQISLGPFETVNSFWSDAGDRYVAVILPKIPRSINCICPANIKIADVASQVHRLDTVWKMQHRDPKLNVAISDHSSVTWPVDVVDDRAQPPSAKRAKVSAASSQAVTVKPVAIEPAPKPSEKAMGKKQPTAAAKASSRKVTSKPRTRAKKSRWTEKRGPTATGLPATAAALRAEDAAKAMSSRVRRKKIASPTQEESEGEEVEQTNEDEEEDPESIEGEEEERAKWKEQEDAELSDEDAEYQEEQESEDESD